MKILEVRLIHYEFRIDGRADLFARRNGDSNNVYVWVIDSSIPILPEGERHYVRKSINSVAVSTVPADLKDTKNQCSTDVRFYEPL